MSRKINKIVLACSGRLDTSAMHLWLKETNGCEVVCYFAESVYYGIWFAPEFEIPRSMIDQTRKTISGGVRLKLYKGSVTLTGRRSPNSLYKERIVTCENNAEGFIKLQALRLRSQKMD